MPVTCVIGLQWGDEAKGKIVDLLTEQHDIVVRYQGGANAGHTVVRDGRTFKLSLIPSGIFRPDVQCVIAAGVVLDPASLLGEIDGLRGLGVKVAGNLIVSDRAHVIFPWHVEEDRLFEQQCGGEPIGTTLRGIGPCYRDKVGRGLAVRLGDMYRPGFRAQIERIIRAKSEIFAALGSAAGIRLDAQEVFAQYQRLCPAAGAPRGRHHRLSARRGRGRPAGALRGRPGRPAGRRPRHLPLRHQQQQFGRGRVGRVRRARPVRHQGARRGQGVQHAGGRRAAAHRARQRHRRADPPPRERIRDRHPPAPPLRLVRRGGRPLLRPAERRGLSGRDVAGRARRIAGAADLHGLRAGRPADHRFPRPRRRSAPRRAGLRDVARLAGGHCRRGAARSVAGQRRKYLDRIGQLLGRPVEIVSVGPDRRQTIFAGD